MKYEIAKPNNSEMKQIALFAQKYNLDTDNLSESNFLVAKNENKLLGFGRIKKHKDLFEISTLGVKPEYRNNGIGETIVESLLGLIKRGEIFVVTIIPDYFTSFGFEVIDDIPKSLDFKKNNCKHTHKSKNVVVLKYSLPNKGIYPIGRYIEPLKFNKDKINELITEIESLPEKFTRAVSQLSKKQLNTKYKPNGWTIRQILSHVPDAHMNAYIRFKLALTENNPTPKSYDEKLWAELPDSKTTPIIVSSTLLKGLHLKWSCLLKSMELEDFSKEYYFPYLSKNIRLDETLSMYVWHGNHHLGQIENMVNRIIKSA